VALGAALAKALASLAAARHGCCYDDDPELEGGAEDLWGEDLGIFCEMGTGSDGGLVFIRRREQGDESVGRWWVDAYWMKCLCSDR
jgi:hypothetical protein